MPTSTHLCKPSNESSKYFSLLGAAFAVASLLAASTLCASAQTATSQNSSPASSSSSTAQPDAPTLTASAETQPAISSSTAMPSPQNGLYARPGAAPPDDYDFHKYTFAFGAGFDMPAGGTAKYQTPGWNIQIAGGRNLNRLFGAQVQYDYDYFGIPRAQLNLVGEPDGDVHLWSFSLDPYVNIPTHGSIQPYVIGGVGFYRKMTEFTQPYASCYYYCYGATAIVAHFSNNAFGANGGVGLNFRASRWNDVKFFAEARYVWVDNQQSNNSATDGYTPANDATGYFPVTFGVRF